MVQEWPSSWSFFPFPVVTIIVRMSKYVTDVNLVPVIVDRGNQTILIATNIKNSQPINIISISKYGFKVIEIIKVFTRHESVPREQRRFCVWMRTPECYKDRFRDDMHDGRRYTKKVFFTSRLRNDDRSARAKEHSRNISGRPESYLRNRFLFILLRPTGISSLNLAGGSFFWAYAPSLA